MADIEKFKNAPLIENYTELQKKTKKVFDILVKTYYDYIIPIGSVDMEPSRNYIEESFLIDKKGRVLNKRDVSNFYIRRDKYLIHDNLYIDMIKLMSIAAIDNGLVFEGVDIITVKEEFYKMKFQFSEYKGDK